MPHRDTVTIEGTAGTIGRIVPDAQVDEALYLDILENANDLIQSIAPDGSLLYVNQAWKRTLGYSDDEVASLNIFDVISPCCMKHCSGLFQRIMAGETVSQVDVEFITKDGSIVHLEGSINCSMSGGKPVATRGIFRDVTERNRMARELQESEERYRQLVEHAPEAILVQSGGRYVYANAEACRLFGASSPDDLIGRDVLSTVHPEYREMVTRRISGVVETGGPSELREQKIVRCDGTAVEVEALGTRISYNGAVATQVIVRDITERKAAERQREAWNRELEQRVAEKTWHLEEAQAKLIQSEKMAMLGEVISGTSHALNNPLAGILGAVQMLARSLSDDGGGEHQEWLEVLQGMEQAATRCQTIVEDLITFSTQTRCYFSRTDLNEVLRGALVVLQGGAGANAVEIVWEPEPELPPLEGDFVKLLETFAAIVKNAREAVGETGRIEIGTEVAGEADARRLVTRVRDTGCGIAPQNLSKIFDPFFSTKGGGQGTGLGLTVSYGVIKRHNGDIDVRSVPGEGTEVTVTLPVRQPR